MRVSAGAAETDIKKAANALEDAYGLYLRPSFAKATEGTRKASGGAYRGRTDDLLHAMQAL